MATMVHLMPFIESPHSFPSAGLDGLWFGHSLPPGPPVGMVVGWRVVPGLLDTWRLERFGQTVHSLFRKTELSRVPVCSQRLPFNNCRSHCAPGNLQPQQECFMTFQRSVHLKKKHKKKKACLWALQAVPLTSWLHFCSDMHCWLRGLQTRLRG